MTDWHLRLTQLCVVLISNTASDEYQAPPILSVGNISRSTPAFKMIFEVVTTDILLAAYFLYFHFLLTWRQLVHKNFLKFIFKKMKKNNNFALGQHRILVAFWTTINQWLISIMLHVIFEGQPKSSNQYLKKFLKGNKFGSLPF